MSRHSANSAPLRETPFLFLRQCLTIAAKDLRAEWRTKEALNASLAFSTVILILFSFALDPNPEMMQEFSGGLLWLVFLFAGALVLNRSFAREMQNDCLDALLASPGPSLRSLFRKNVGELRVIDDAGIAVSGGVRNLIQCALAPERRAAGAGAWRSAPGR